MAKPLETGAAALYPYSSSLEFRLQRKSRYGDLIELGKVAVRSGEKYLMTPRAASPMGEVDVRDPGKRVVFQSLFKPRDAEQSRVVDEAGTLLADDQSFIIEAPTGTGKTVMSMELIARVGRKTLITVHKQDLRDQWIEALKTFLGLADNEIGLIQGDKFQVRGRKVVVAMLQTLATGKYGEDAFKGFGLWVADEVHRVGADHFSQACWLVPAKLRLGLSATPTRKDGKDIVIFGHIGPIRVRATALKMTPKVLVIESGWKVPRVVRNTKTGGARRVQIPHSPGRINHINKILVRDRQRNLMIGRFVHNAYQKGRTVLVLSEMKIHLEEMQAVLRQYGIPYRDIGLYVGGRSKAEIQVAKTRKVLLATYQYCSEGTDIPWLDTLVLGTPRADVIQIVGRILREHEGKRAPVVLDVVDRDSRVFDSYAQSRIKWYHKVKAKIKFLS